MNNTRNNTTRLKLYFESLNKTHKSLYSELKTEFVGDFTKFFKYEKNLIDPFQAITLEPATDNSVLNHLHEWYETINPSYIPIKDLNPSIGEFKGIQPYRTLLLGISKDLIILNVTEKFPKPKIPIITNNNNSILKQNTSKYRMYNSNKRTIRRETEERYNLNNATKRTARPGNVQNINKITTNNSRGLYLLDRITDDMKSKILELLNLINNILESNNYIYLAIINIIDKYLLLFSFGGKPQDKYSNLLLEIYNTPFIVYPTFNMVSYTKVIYFIQAPVMNFNIMNTRKLVHKNYECPYFQIAHDIDNHSSRTHTYRKGNFKSLKYPDNNNNNNALKTSNIKLLFNKTNNIINLLKNYINYNITYFKNDNITIDDDDVKKFILCYSLFILCHEISSGINIFTSFNNLIKNVKDNKYVFILEHEKDSIIETFPPPLYKMHLLPPFEKFYDITLAQIESIKSEAKL
jgi:hypothetical protein